MTTKILPKKNPSSDSYHHWLIPKGGWGTKIPDKIKNQPWNLNPMNAKFDNKLGNGWKRLLGAPPYANDVAYGIGAAAAEIIDKDSCDCR